MRQPLGVVAGLTPFNFPAMIPMWMFGVAIVVGNKYGNGVAIFTQNGRAARDFAARVNVGMVGINVPIPVPVAYDTFRGWKRSAFGDTTSTAWKA